jgi:hypothetical protein
LDYFRIARDWARGHRDELRGTVLADPQNRQLAFSTAEVHNARVSTIINGYRTKIL